MVKLFPGCDLSTETVVTLINDGLKRSIRRGATPQATTEKLIKLYIGDFENFFRSARDDFTRRKLPNAISESEDAAVDQCGLIQLMILALASEIHIVKLLQQRISEQDRIRKELVEATANFPKDLINKEGSTVEDYLERRQGLPSIKSLYFRATNHDLPDVIDRRMTGAQLGPAHMFIDIPSVKAALVAFTYYPADRPFEYKPGNPLQQQGASRPDQGRTWEQQQQQMQQ